MTNWRPKQSLTFLRSLWFKNGIERSPTLDDTLVQAILSISINIKEKDKARVKGFLNYYLYFTGPVHSIISRAQAEPDIGNTYLFKLIECRKIKSKDSTSEQNLEVFTDATPLRLGWTHDKGKGTAALTQDLPIMLNKTLAALKGIYSAINDKSTTIKCHRHNMATRAFLRRGAAKFLYNINFPIHFSLIFLLCKIRHLTYLETDELTRL